VIALCALAESALGFPIAPQPSAQVGADKLQADFTGATGEIFQSFKDECGLPSGLHIEPGSLALLENPGFPGAGMNASAITPFQTVLKDGFMKVECVKDMMFSQGDKHGPNKHSYNQGQISGVSIIRYDEYVAKLDRKPMTQKVCFDFCRTVPNMGFFGVINGRHCYCTPFYKAQASDSSMCDAPCDGSPNTMCGGKEKSMVFAMHFCDDSAQVLAAAIAKGNTTAGSLLTKCGLVDGLAADTMAIADYLQPQFGAVGDSVATTNLQKAKTTAGLMLRDSYKACVNGSQGSLATAVTDAQGAAAGVLIAEKHTRDINAKVETAKAAEDRMDALIAQAQNAQDVGNSSLDYYPLVYFIDKDLLNASDPLANSTKVPSTCGGKAVGKSIIATNKDSCASACNAAVGGCVGFQYFESLAKPTANLCLLFGEFKSISYYTGCGAAGPYSFLQQRQTTEEDMLNAPYEATCYGKFSKFQGLSLKKISKKMNRCYQVPA